MENKRLKLKYPVIVEGRYDKASLANIIDAPIITTGGFAIFNSKEKRALIEKLGKNGIILFTDSDGGGMQIRKFLHGIMPRELVFDAYIPKIEGKERRKKTRSKEGLLGVEGMEREIVLRALSPFSDDGTSIAERTPITKLDFYFDGLSGGEGSRERRAKLLSFAGLPDDMSANAMLEAFNLLFGREEYKAILKDCFVDF